VESDAVEIEEVDQLTERDAMKGIAVAVIEHHIRMA
jgi:hypothetical protein